MSKPIFYTLDMSPCCRSVYLTSAAIGVDFEIREIDIFKSEHLSEDFVKINPARTIPTLDDNGFILADSHAIMCYLVSKYAKDDSLYPKDIHRRAKVDQFLYFDASELFPPLKRACKPIVMKRTTSVPDDQLEAMKTPCVYLDEYLDGKVFLTGDSYTIADIACFNTITCIIPFVSMEELPNIVAWMERCEEQFPEYEKFGAPGCNQLQELIRQQLSTST
ncbi:glutathione S-transferase 1-like [Prorops nasuta]|uniref:glutathione S-transferase 1-like n=1 Tax=Prorops nasuta TaxID=863751 RepID=UPI0034CD0226